MPATPESLELFVSSCQGLKDEKSDSQTFLNRFFQAFGYADAIAAGAIFEARVKKGSKKGNTGFADLSWQPHLLIEMKKGGEDLSKHYAQAVTYWQKLLCPTYMILCNFDEFWIYNFKKQSDEPIEKIPLERLPERIGAFTFMNPELGREPVFNNNLIEVTEKAAGRMGTLLTMLIERKRDAVEAQVAQRFVLQCVLAMFAEDRKLLPPDLFIGLVRECLERSRLGQPSNTYDVLGGLFGAMNRSGVASAGRYQRVEYFNGGLFREVNPIELTMKELELLEAAACQDWKAVRPSIFGNIFESAIGKSNSKERHAHGIHFTSEEDILKIVRPTITQFWEEKIEGASKWAELSALQEEMRNYKVLDPACGSGNFLYMAYLELKRLEKVLQDKIDADPKSKSGAGQISMGFVTPQQFYGMDTNAFAVELARVTLMIARKVAIDICGIVDQPALPLDTLDENIVCKDALFTEWVKADAIIGNPPFLGGRRMRLSLGDDYVEKIFSTYPEVKDAVDFGAYWFRLAHECIGISGRAGLVGTNSISQGKSRTASLDYILQNEGYIYEATSTQPWSGEASVHVCIVNWSKKPSLKQYLDSVEVPAINSSLSASIDVTKAFKLSINHNYCFLGVIPIGKGFIVTPEQASNWINQDERNQAVLKPFSDATSLVDSPCGRPNRWIIDFRNLNLEDASDYSIPINYIKQLVKPQRDTNKKSIYKNNWWKHGEPQLTMRELIDKQSCYFNIPRHSKWFIFIPTFKDRLPGDSTVVVASDDFYILGILTSNVHRTWIKAQCSTLKGDTRYTNTTCFETFPFPQTPIAKQIEAIRKTAIDLHEYRSVQMEKKQWGITKLYNEYFNESASQLVKLHKTLDDLVLKAYGFSKTDDLLEKLLALNLDVAEKEKNGESVVGPWAPDKPPEAS